MTICFFVLVKGLCDVVLIFTKSFKIGTLPELMNTGAATMLTFNSKAL